MPFTSHQRHHKNSLSPCGLTKKTSIEEVPPLKNYMRAYRNEV
jgi:hypothetical protein